MKISKEFLYRSRIGLLTLKYDILDTGLENVAKVLVEP